MCLLICLGRMFNAFVIFLYRCFIKGTTDSDIAEQTVLVAIGVPISYCYFRIDYFMSRTSAALQQLRLNDELYMCMQLRQPSFSKGGSRTSINYYYRKGHLKIAFRLLVDILKTRVLIV